MKRTWRPPPTKKVPEGAEGEGENLDDEVPGAVLEAGGDRPRRHRRCGAQIDWFERHVRGIEYRWETALDGGDPDRKVTTDGESP